MEDMMTRQPAGNAASLLGGWTWERVGLAALVLALAAAAFFPENFITEFSIIGSQWTFPLNILLPLLIVAALALIVRYHGGLGFFPVDAVLIIFSVYVVVRNIPVDALFSMRYVLTSGAVFYLSAVLARDAYRLRQVMLSITMISLVASIYGLLEFAAQANIIYRDHISVGVPEDVLHRVGSLMAHPVVFGAFLVQTLPFAIYVWSQEKAKSFRMIGLAAMLAGTVNLFLTASKGSWIVAFLLGAVATIYFTIKRGRKSLIISLTLVLLVALTAAIFSNRLSLEDIFRTDTSVSVRVISWEAAYDGIRDNLLFGVGIREGNQEVVERISGWWIELTGLSPPADNFFINIMLEEGLIGALAWLALVSLILAGGVNAIRRGGGQRFIQITALVSIIALLINIFTFDGLILWPNTVLFWVAAGILRGHLVRDDAGSEAAPEPGLL